MVLAKGAVSTMSGVDTRNIARDSLFLLAELRLDAALGDYRVKVRNLSGGGMMAEGQVPVVPGHRLQVKLRNIGWVEGAVAWVQENRFGIAFDREIDPKLARPSAAASKQADAVSPQFLRTHASVLGNLPSRQEKFRKI